MKRQFAITAAAILVAAASTTLMAATKTYKYKCPRCGLIQEFSKQTIYKCPQDGTTMNSLK